LVRTIDNNQEDLDWEAIYILHFTFIKEESVEKKKEHNICR